MIRHITWLGAIALMAAVVGCSTQTATETPATSGRPSADGAKYLLSAAPEGAQDVIPLREAVEDQQDVVVVGRIGGDENPWVDGLAAFSLVDRSLAACSDMPGDACPTPWDYCCVTDKLPAAKTLVKVVDDEGRVLQADARELLGLKELQTVVVSGTVQRDDAGNVTILARGIYIDPANPGQVPHGAAAHAHDHDHEHHDHAHSHDGDPPHDHQGESAEEHGHDHHHPATGERADS